METVLMDTSILVGRMRRDPAAFAASDRAKENALVICDAVLTEILAGDCNRAEYERHHAELTSNFSILPFTMEVSQRFREILKHIAPEHQVHLADHLIAATAMAHDAALLTLNKKHFMPIKGLRLA